MDNITIKGMEFYAYHGVLCEENRLGQRFIVDLKIELDLREAGKNDSLEATVNYAEVYETIKKIVQGKKVKLIEALGEAIANILLEKYRIINNISVTIHKPNAPIAGIFADVSVTINR